MKATEELDQVCGIWIHKETALFQSLFKEKTYYFCSKSCKEHFDQDPGWYMNVFEG